MLKPVRRCRSDTALDRCGAYLADGGWLSQIYDSGVSGTEWDRLRADAAGNVTVRVYVSDRRDALEAEPGALPAPALCAQADDLLLYGARGRYLRLAVYPGGALRAYELTFPKRTIAALLPEPYAGNETLERYLGVAQSAYLDISEELARFPARLDPRAPDALPGLANWVGAGRWQAENALRRALTTAAPTLARRRGTGAGLMQLATLVTGRRATLVEGFRWGATARGEAQRHALRRLYGEERRGAALLLPPGVPDADAEALRALLPAFCPAGVRCRLVRLSEAAPLGGHCYLGVNSRLAAPPRPYVGEARAGGVRLE